MVQILCHYWNEYLTIFSNRVYTIDVSGCLADMETRLVFAGVSSHLNPDIFPRNTPKCYTNSIKMVDACLTAARQAGITRQSGRAVLTGINTNYTHKL